MGVGERIKRIMDTALRSQAAARKIPGYLENVHQFDPILFFKNCNDITRKIILSREIIKILTNLYNEHSSEDKKEIDDVMPELLSTIKAAADDLLKNPSLEITEEVKQASWTNTIGTTSSQSMTK